MAVQTYNDYLRQILSNKECVLAFDTAADFLGLTNGGIRQEAQIFVTEQQDIKGTQEFLIPSFEQLEWKEYHGLLCTTINQTIIDLLEQNGDEQIITESLANYYEEHNGSFKDLQIPKHLEERFRKYSQWAIEYYEE